MTKEEKLAKKQAKQQAKEQAKQQAKEQKRAEKQRRKEERAAEKQRKKEAAAKPKKSTAADGEEGGKKKARPKNYHVTLRDDGMWQVKFAKGEKAIKLFDTQVEAIAFAKEKAENQHGWVTIHKKDGSIRKQRY